MLFRDARLADGRVRDVRVESGRIAAVDRSLAAADDDQIVEADERLLLPGAIDAHVHFREPGHAHKETWATGSRSAAAGGVTTAVDQPNTTPPTISGEAFDEKASLAAGSCIDYGLNGGVTPEWDPDSLFDRPLFALGEVFLADSTGDMGIDADLFADAVERAADADVVVTVHAEDADLFDESARERDAGGVGRDADATSGVGTAAPRRRPRPSSAQSTSARRPVPTSTSHTRVRPRASTRPSLAARPAKRPRITSFSPARTRPNWERTGG